jgi:hypothetical protein
MKRMYKKIIVITSVSVGLVCGVLNLALFYYYMGVSPQSPNLVTGQVCPFNNHGYIFYVTRNQGLWEDILRYAFIVFAFGGGLLGVRWKTIKNIYEDLPKKLY